MNQYTTERKCIQNDSNAFALNNTVIGMLLREVTKWGECMGEWGTTTSRPVITVESYTDESATLNHWT